ncbi:hypothetical protein CJ030_MR1G027483 [Morella rubra]|uniref:Protein PATRONUS 2 n=1 Tax=Morella rubra TaxID=262757 RepID=A0A6A1WN88_9ROSI|nr:hypothetical protein CJ030_MR1G027483 [Morella rubra]
MKSSKAAPKKGGLGFRGRKALNDIANKSSFHHEASSRKNNFRKEEKVLHDHKKCIEAQQKTVDTFYLDLVRPGRGIGPKFMDPKNLEDSVCTAGPQDSKETELLLTMYFSLHNCQFVIYHDLESPRCYPEPAELPMAEFTDWLSFPTEWISPPCSPMHWDSPSLSTLPWESEVVDFTLKQECD